MRRELGFTEIRAVEVLSRDIQTARPSFDQLSSLQGRGSSCRSQSRAAQAGTTHATGISSKSESLGDTPMDPVEIDYSATTVTRPYPEMKGHTGYLTFAKKPLDE